jgi:hypothetical protein
MFLDSIDYEILDQDRIYLFRTLLMKRYLLY